MVRVEFLLTTCARKGRSTMLRRTVIGNLVNAKSLSGLISALCIVMAAAMPLSAGAQDELVVDWDIEYETMAPTLESALVVENLSNGRYRASIDVSLTAQWDLYLRYFIASPAPATAASPCAIASRRTRSETRSTQV